VQQVGLGEALLRCGAIKPLLIAVAVWNWVQQDNFCRWVDGGTPVIRPVRSPTYT